MDNVWYVDFKYIESVSKEIIECRRIKKKKQTRKRYASVEFSRSLFLLRKPQQGLVKYSSTQDICRRSGN